MFFWTVNESFDIKFEKLITTVIFVGKKLLVIKFLVFKETVVLCWRESGTNELIKVEYTILQLLASLPGLQMKVRLEVTLF